MDYRYLRAFLAVARHLNFSRAAEELRVAQSAVTRQIKLLERNVGHELLFRTRQVVRLTDQGRRLFEQAGRLDTWVREEFGRERPSLRVGAIPGLVDTFLIPRLTRIPLLREMNLKLHVDAQPAVVAMLERDEIDLCLVHASVEIPGMVSRVIRKEEIFVVGKEKFDIKHLERYCWIHMGTAQFLRRAARTASTHQIVVNSLHAIMSLVEAGLGIAAVPDYAIEGRRGLNRVKLPFRGHISLAHRQHSIWPAKLKEVISALASPP